MEKLIKENETMLNDLTSSIDNLKDNLNKTCSILSSIDGCLTNITKNINRQQDSALKTKSTIFSLQNLVNGIMNSTNKESVERDPSKVHTVFTYTKLSNDTKVESNTRQI